MLRREGIVLNRKKLYRLDREERLMVRKRVLVLWGKHGVSDLCSIIHSSPVEVFLQQR